MAKRVHKIAALLVCGMALAAGSPNGKPQRLPIQDIKVTRVTCDYDPKNTGMNFECMSSLQWCLKVCDAEYDARAAYCSTMGYTPQAAVCHGANSVIYGGCRSDCHANN